MPEDLFDLQSEDRTTADDVFEKLRDDIVSMSLPPGSKLSEAEIASRFEISRQPVREAFIRLSDLNLVSIRPRRATVVRRISKSEIAESRFIRTAVEIEVVRLACALYDGTLEDAFVENLERQRQAVEAGDAEAINALDYEFHQLVCRAANCDFAYRVIAENKFSVDRLCALSLADKASQEEIYLDHKRTFEFMKAGDREGCVRSTRIHLSRLNDIIASAEKLYPDYFDE